VKSVSIKDVIPVHQFLRIAARSTDYRPTIQPIEKHIFFLSVPVHGPGWIDFKNVVFKVHNLSPNDNRKSAKSKNFICSYCIYIEKAGRPLKHHIFSCYLFTKINLHLGFPPRISYQL